MNIQDTVTLANGVKMPWFGLGVWQVENGEEVKNSVKWALEAGYRHIDTAQGYGNEEGVGQAIRESGIKREEIFVTTKVWNASQGYETTLKAFEETNQRLGLDYVDMYLIHWPVKGKYKDTWRAMEELYNQKLIRSIGVSNFQIHHLEDLMKDSTVTPMVNQVEIHPYLTQEPLRQFCESHGIIPEAYSPLGTGQVLKDPVLVEIAQKYNKTVAQVILRWDLEIGVITIPKSVHEDRIYENADIFDFSLAPEDIEKINGLNKNQRFGNDPDNFNF